MKNGFTLVELSIVLVIIGLLTGGILVGQSLIESAKTSKLIRDLGQYEVAIKLFRNTYKALPGDSPHFGVPGNNNGTLEQVATCNGVFSEDERGQFWGDLSESKMISTEYIGWQPSGAPCNGTHAIDRYDRSLAGLVWPVRDHDDRAEALIGRTLTPLVPILHSTSQNLRLPLFSNAIEAIAIEAKMGSQSSSTNHTETGIVNAQDPGKCIASLSPTVTVSCGDPDAIYGVLYYYIGR